MLSAILKRQLAGEDYLPKYNYHVTDSIVSLEDERLMFTVVCRGMPFDVVSEKRLDADYDGLNNLLLGIGKNTGSRLAVWAHLDHYKTRFEHNYQFGFTWLQNFADKYMEKFCNTDIFENRFYLTFVIKPGLNDGINECIRDLTEIQLMVMQSLRQYECELLQTYELNGNLFSQVYEFIGYLYNGFWEPVPVTSLPLQQAIQTSDLHHSYRVFETRFPDGGTMFSSLFDLKDFPEPTKRGMTNAVIELPFEFILCHSISLINPADSIRMINQALNKLESAGDEAHQQHDDLEEGKGAVMSGDIYFGEYHSVLLVKGSSPKEVEKNGALARTTLSSFCASSYVPATLSAPASFYSIFPAAFKHRPRLMPKTTRNFFGMFSMNTFSSGKQYGNPIGDGTAVIPLKTSARGVYHFNFHYSKLDDDSIGMKKAGHTHICGATGTGKTTLQTTLLSFVERFNAKVFAADKDGSMRGCIEALGGTYFTLRSGEPTGLNPFQLPDTPLNRNYLYDLVGACGREAIGIELRAEEIRDIKIAVDNLYNIDFEHRRFSVVLQNIQDRGENSLYRRLEKWCYGESEGRFAYALDNPRNNFDWESLVRVGFDVSDFLVEGHPATEPILSYLFHLKNLMQRDGGLLATVVEEYWLPISYPTTAKQILDSLKTGRRRDEFILLVTQSPEDAIKSPLLPTILQQTPTKIFLPNPDAEYQTNDGGGYIRFGLSKKEFAKLKSLDSESRKFIVKQGSQSNVATLDLSDSLDVIAVLAMAAEDFPYLEQAKQIAGAHPDEWVPVYSQLRAAGKKKN